jgi:lysophospholipase L1-like esterase
MVMLCSVTSIVAAQFTIICFGDSTTAPRAGVVTYCDTLKETFASQPKIVVINKGVPGNTTAAARLRFQKDVLENHPDLVLIGFGINDSSVDVWHKPPENKPRVALEEYRNNLRYFVQALKAARAQAVLLTFNPMTWSPKLKDLYGKPPYDAASADGLNIGRGEYLAAIRATAKEEQVELLDVDAAFRAYSAQPGKELSHLLQDGIHPNSLGHQLVTGLVKPVVLSALKRRNIAYKP